MKGETIDKRDISLEDRVALLESKVKELFQLILFLAKETHILDSDLVDRSLKSLRREAADKKVW